MIRSHRARRRYRAYLAVLAVPAIIAGAYFAVAGGSSGSADSGATAPVDLHVPLGMTPDDLGQWCIDAQQRGTSGLSRRAVDWLKGCADSFGRHPQTPEPTSPSTTAPGTPTTAPSNGPTTNPPTTTKPPTAPTGGTPTITGWPGATNTGVPAGTALTAYTGPCNITAANTVIDAKTISCGTLTINAANVTITRSRLTGTGDPQIAANGGSVTVSDSTLAVGLGATGIAGKNWTGLRLDISGGNRGAYCSTTCTLMDSWVHGTRIDKASGQHASGIRAEQYTLYQHNTLSCDLPSSATECSADVTMYADFAPVHDVRIINNLMVASPAATFCAYGGDSGGKPYSNDPTNATNIVFTGNVFQRGTSGHCAGDPRGTAVGSFDKSGAGNVWQGNKYDDGVAINI